jgi:hypothetical protein
VKNRFQNVPFKCNLQRYTMGPKPAGCFTLFMGNLNFMIDDATMHSFFKEEAGAEMVTVRWLTHKESGEFRGGGCASWTHLTPSSKATGFGFNP